MLVDAEKDKEDRKRQIKGKERKRAKFSATSRNEYKCYQKCYEEKQENYYISMNISC